MAQLEPVRIRGVGSAVPKGILTNADLEGIVSTNDEWIVSRTGIRERHKLGEGENNTDIAAAAAQAALVDAGLTPEDLDMVLVATCSGDSMIPSTACRVAGALGLNRTPALEVNTACTGFVYGCSVGMQYVRTGAMKNILVVGTEALTRLTDYTDRGTCILFGDGAGAVVLSAGEGPPQMLDSALGADGSDAARNMITVNLGTSFLPNQQMIETNDYCIRMQGREVYKFAVNTVTSMIREAMDKHNLQPADVGMVVPHQANDRILAAARERLGLSEEQFYSNVERFGNTSAASIPIALRELMDQDRIPKGKHVIFVGFGGGLTWGSIVCLF